jgi:hypothetical protein
MTISAPKAAVATGLAKNSRRAGEELARQAAEWRFGFG